MADDDAGMADGDAGKLWLSVEVQRGMFLKLLEFRQGNLSIRSLGVRQGRQLAEFHAGDGTWSCHFAC